MVCKISLLSLCFFGVLLQTYGYTLRPRSSEIEEIDVRYVKLEVDGKEYNLTLRQREREIVFETTPVWILESSSEKEYKYANVSDDEYRINGIFYEDVNYMASLFAYYNEDEHQILYDGVLGASAKPHVVRSIPEKWWTIPRPINDETSKLRSGYVPSEKTDDSEHELDVLHPKILVVVDNKLYQQLGRKVDETIKYVAKFWNAVDLRYVKLNSTRIEIIVTGIIIVSDEQSNLLAEARDYFNDNFIVDTEMTNYDATFVMTTSDVGTLEGKIHLGLICDRKYSTVFVQDNANYEGLISAVHNLGHLLNLPHDGSDEAESCRVDSNDHATVMAEATSDAPVIVWSECSEKIIKQFAKSKAAECLGKTDRYE